MTLCGLVVRAELDQVIVLRRILSGQRVSSGACLPAGLGRGLPNAGYLRPQTRDESVNIFSKCPKAQAKTFTRWLYIGKAIALRFGRYVHSPGV